MILGTRNVGKDWENWEKLRKNRHMRNTEGFVMPMIGRLGMPRIKIIALCTLRFVCARWWRRLSLYEPV